MCAETTTYSSFSLGSLPGSTATTLSDVTAWEDCLVATRSLPAISNFGSGLSCLAAAMISAKVCPESANHFSAWAGLTTTASWRPAVSFSDGSASVKTGSVRLFARRGQGMSMLSGFRMRTTPSAPAFFSAFHRSAIDCA